MHLAMSHAPASAALTPVDWLDLVAGTFSELRTIIRERNANDGAGFTEQYEKLRLVNSMGSCAVGREPRNKEKNRYNNVMAYDATRVVLNSKKRTDDYINANWIPGATSPRDYIASQGPVPASIEDFWQMVWQFKVLHGDRFMAIESWCL